MSKKIFIDGNLIAYPGSLYARDVCAGETVPPIGAEVIVPEDGSLYLIHDTGSIFDTYFVNGEVTAAGGENGDIYAYKNIYEFTVRDYNEGMNRLKGLMEAEISPEFQQLFYQQQFSSCFSLLESFLSGTLIWETCNREDAYHRVWDSGCLNRTKKDDQQKVIAKGADCLEKELLYIELANQLIYHNAFFVRNLFRAAFDIDVDLSSLGDDLQKRHDIVHRNGYSKKGETVLVTHDEIATLLAKIDVVVQYVIGQIAQLPSSDC